MKPWESRSLALWLTVVPMSVPVALAHDPVFGLGPHTLYKGGVEIHFGSHQEKAGDERATESEIQFKYGLTSDWVAGIGVPYVRSTGHRGSDSGRGPTSLSTKYRFWRNDLPGAQESSAVVARMILDDGDMGHGQAEREGNDYLLGLTYGYEGRKWYRWASLRRRFNGDAENGAARPDKWLADLVVGIRPIPTEYLEPDWVWMLELNYEHTEHITGAFNGSPQRIGGDQWFLSPGLMWTYRNFAVKAGVQLPVYDDLSGDQEADDYRALVELEWHL
ncbi:MAG: hypothetical protein CMK32_08320 [Porticoccaceae bacterium]|nr:hypothetical protein [Porticoccaceae bacterium]